MPIFNSRWQARPPGRPYAQPGERDPLDEMVALTQQLAQYLAAHDLRYLVEMLCSARNGGSRIGAIVGAVEGGRYLSHLGVVTVEGLGEITGRQLVDAVCVRADDPGEALAYWLATYGKPIPKWLKRGVGDAILRLYTPATAVDYDRPRYWLRFADVIELSDIRASYGDETGLFRQLLDDRPRAGSRAS